MRVSLAAVVAVVFFNSGAAGVSVADIHNDGIERSPLMRKEVRIQEHRQGRNHGDPTATWPVQKMSSQECDDVYPVGSMNKSCTDSNATYLEVMSMEMCRQAATANHAAVMNDIFEIPSSFFDLRPQGCFEWECRTPQTGTCYYYNEGQPPSEQFGEPVCVQYKYNEGKTEKTGTEGVSCPAGYQSIQDEDLCDEAAQCLGKCEGYEFRMADWNLTQYDDFPVGCFIHASVVSGDGKNCVFFNPRRHFDRVPMLPAGTPICDVIGRRHETLNLIASKKAAASTPTAAPTNSSTDASNNASSR